MVQNYREKFEEFVHRSTSRLWLASSLLGIGRTIFWLPIEHPFDTMRVQWQTNPKLKNEYEVVNKIISEKGLKGLYSGYLASWIKQIVKSSYRFPMMAILPRIWGNFLGTEYFSNKHKMKLITSISIAVVEAFIISPIERLQVFIMTSKDNKGNYKDFLEMMKGKRRAEIFKGFSTYFTRQLVAWTAFLQSDVFVKAKIRKLYGIRDDEMISGYKLVVASFIISWMTISCTMPFDNIKTYLQKYHLMKVQGSNVEVNNNLRNIPKAITNIYANGGLLGFFTGWRVKLWAYWVNALFTVSLLEWLENLSNDLIVWKDSKNSDNSKK